MADSKDKGRVLNNGVNNPIVADSEFPKTCEFACEGWEVVCPIRQLFFDFSYNPFRLIFVTLLEVARYRPLECDLIAQDLSSYHQS